MNLLSHLCCKNTDLQRFTLTPIGAHKAKNQTRDNQIIDHSRIDGIFCAPYLLSLH